MKPTYDEIAKWMREYFETYNLHAQYEDTVHEMDRFFAPDLRFMPYMYLFGGPGAGHTSRESFYAMLTGHPDDYEQFEVLDIFVDERRLVATAFLKATVFDANTDLPIVQKHYLPLYELTVDDNDQLKIKTIRFFWEASPPEIEEKAYSGAGKGH